MNPMADDGQTTQTVPLVEVFKNRNFALLWIGQVVAYLGDNIFKMAIVAIVTFGLTSRNDKAVEQTWVTVMGNIPYFIFPLIFATLIERTDRRWMLTWMDIYRAVLIGFAALFLTTASPKYLAFGLVFLVYAGTSIFYPAKSLFITEIVSPRHLLRANSVSTTIGSLMALFGTLIGTRLVEAVGIEKTLFITAGAYLFSMVTLLAINKERQGQVTDSSGTQNRESQGAIRELKEGWHITRTNPIALSAVLMFGWIWGVIGSFFSILTAIIYSKLAPVMGRVTDEDALNLQGEVLGLIGVSLFVGGVVVGRLANWVPLSRLLTIAFVGAGVTILALIIPGAMSTPWVALTLFAALGTFGGGILIPMETAIGKGVPQEVRGRVFAFNTVFHCILLSAMMALSNYYIKLTESVSWQLEVGLAFTGILALVGATLTRLLPRGIILANMTPDSGNLQGASK